VFLPFFFSWAGMFFLAYLKYNTLAAKKQQKKKSFPQGINRLGTLAAFDLARDLNKIRK